MQMPRLILLVEDSEQCASNLEIALSTLPGVEVIWAPSGREALHVLDTTVERRISAVVTDLDMPDVDGFELVKAVRTHSRYAGLPIIVVSGNTDPELGRRLQALGADAFLSKPYSPGEVRNKLEQYLYGRLKRD